MYKQSGKLCSTGLDFDLNPYGGNYEKNYDFSVLNVAPCIENIFHFSNLFSVTQGFSYEYINSHADGYWLNPHTFIEINAKYTGKWPVCK